MKKLLAITGLALLLVNEGRSQSVPVYKNSTAVVNQACPNFVFDTLLNYKKEKLSIADCKGKFVILDFWGTFCLPCITAFPEIADLQKRFGDTLQVLLVATDGYQKAKQFYEARKKSSNPMVLPCSVNREAAAYFQVHTVSTYVWIDDQGIIKAITDESQLTEQNIADFIHKKNTQFRGIEQKAIADYKRYLVTMANEMDSNNVLYNSSLTKYLKGVTGSYYYPPKGVGTKVRATNMSISNLYRIAFGDSTGAVPYNRTVIDAPHPEKYALPKDWDFETWKYDNAFCYELRVPVAKQHDILKIMLEDLNRVFNVSVHMETRTQKCLILSAEKHALVQEGVSAPPEFVISAGGVTIINHPFAQFTEVVQHYLPKEIVLDETGISGKVAISIQAAMNDVNSLNEALKKYGLHLQYEDRPMQMLIIKDPQ